jgi:AraC-like DNA-binding protein
LTLSAKFIDKIRQNASSSSTKPPIKSDGSLAPLGQILYRLVELHGIDPRSFMMQVGLDPDVFRDPKARLPVRLLDAAFLRAASLIPDPAFGLRTAECWHPSNLGPVGYAWLSSGSLRTALKRFDRYSRILGSQYSDHCVEEADGLRYVFDHGRGDAAIGPVIADFTLSMILSMCRMNYGAALHPASVKLRRPEPKDPSPWTRFFGCEIAFSASEDSFLLDHRTAEMPLPSGNQELAATFDLILSEQLAALTRGDLKSRCKFFLLQQLTSGEPSEEVLAGQVGMSGRSLQRKLAEAGLTYGQVLAETRYELARRYLDDPNRSVTEITFLLGFSEHSAFTRAFKRWSGMAPTAYRAQRAGLH